DTRIGCPEGDMGVGVPGKREIHVGFGQIDAGHACDLRDLRHSERQAAGSAADIENTVTVRKATELDQHRREASAPPSHGHFVCFGVLETGSGSGIRVGHRGRPTQLSFREIPPSTTSSMPVTYFDSSEARYKQA